MCVFVFVCKSVCVSVSIPPPLIQHDRRTARDGWRDGGREVGRKGDGGRGGMEWREVGERGRKEWEEGEGRGGRGGKEEAREEGVG